MIICIPCSGRGIRFSQVGYNEPKQLININGYPMIYRVIENICPERHGYENIDYKFIFIFLDSFWKEHGWYFEKLLSKMPLVKEYEILTINHVTEGPPQTILMLAEHLINNDEEFIIANSDQLVVDENFMNNSIDFYRKNNADGGILCFLNDDPKWSYVEYKDSKIIRTVEKEKISDIATVGIYYWKHGKDFVSSVKKMIDAKDKFNNEYYTCPSYNYMIADGKLVLPYMINNMHGLGTPKDVEKFLNETK